MKRLQRFLPTLITLLGLGFVVYFLAFKVSLKEIGAYLRNGNLGLMGLSLLLILVMVLLKGVRWSYLLKMQGVSYPVWDSYLIYMGSLFWGTVTPGRMGDFMKVLYLKRDRKMGLGLGMSSVLVDRVFDLYILLILGCLGLLLHPLPDNPNMVKGVWIFFAILVMVTIVAFNKKTGEWLIKTVFQKAMGDKLSGHADQAFHDFHRGMESFYRPALLWPALLTVMSYILFFIGCWFLALSLNINIGPAYLAFCIAVVNIVSLVSFAGVGTREGALLILFGLEHFSQSQAMAYDAVFVFVGTILICALGFLAYLLKPVKFGKDSLLSDEP
jgi:uncharacterized protein (TIRG00374 family)